MKKTLAAIALALALMGCGDKATSDPATKIDPYEQYVANNPDPDLKLSREDAALRAKLGCGQKWAPGTVDAVLQEAYRDYC